MIQIQIPNTLFIPEEKLFEVSNSSNSSATYLAMNDLGFHILITDLS